MKEPERLFTTDPDLARLHEMLDGDEPPPGAVGRTTARLLADGLSPTAASAGAGPRSAFKTWIAVGIGAAVVVASALMWPPRTQPSANRESLPNAEATPAAASLAVDRATAPRDVDERRAEPSIHVDDLPAASPPAPSPGGSADPFIEELALVERARAALARGDGRECLEATNRYATRFATRGLLGEEVEVMHIEALAMSGERAAARTRGLRFLDAHPETPYGERLRRVLDHAAE